MSWLIWVRGLIGPCPQKTFDGAGGKPFLETSIKDSVLSERRLTDAEDEMSLEELAALYPAPTGEPA